MNHVRKNKRDVEGGEKGVQSEESKYCLMHVPLDERCLMMSWEEDSVMFSVELVLPEMMLV